MTKPLKIILYAVLFFPLVFTGVGTLAFVQIVLRTKEFTLNDFYFGLALGLFLWISETNVVISLIKGNYKA